VQLNAAAALGEMGDPRAVAILLRALKTHDTTIIIGATSFYIKRGNTGSENTLIEVLENAGSGIMAQQFLTSGNSKLEQAASEWADKHGYRVMVQPGGGGGPTWGSAR
jgi:HEAT repeat protein